MRLRGGLGAAGVACLLVAAVLLLLNRGPGDFGDVPEGAPYGAVVQGPAGPPAGVRLPGGDLVTVESIGVSPTGTLEPPARVARAGWWRGGAAMGDPAGTVVLAGHVDAARQGIGSFEQLWQSRPGDAIGLRDQVGQEVQYRVTGTRVYPRTRALPADVFAVDGPRRLALITCAGSFDRRTGHYAETLVVYAVPV